MDKHHCGIVRIFCALSILVLMFSFSETLNAQAQEPTPTCPREGCLGASDGSDVTGQATANLKLYYKVTQKGFYVANGVGMANQGYGTIISPALFPGSTVTKAFLFWNIVGPQSVTGFNYAKGVFNLHTIYGTLLGTTNVDAWYGPLIKAHSYRADVTATAPKTPMVMDCRMAGS